MIGLLGRHAARGEAVICLLSILDGIAPPNINYDTPDPNATLILLRTRRVKPRFATMSTRGIGGHNASLILTRYE